MSVFFRTLVASLMLVASLFSGVAYAALELTLEMTSEVALSNPHDLALSPDGKYLFVSDVGNNRIAILDPDTLALVGEFGSDHQAGTHDVDFDDKGNVYVADTHNNRVTIYRLDGLEATLTGELSDAIRGPEGVVVHPNGNIYVAGAWSNNLVAYRNGKVVAQLTGNNRMLRLSPELKTRQELSGEPFNFNGVRYQAVREDGSLIAADKNNHQVKAISADGKLIAVFGSGDPGQWPAGFKTPEGVETRGKRLWISDSGNNRVLRFLSNSTTPSCVASRYWLAPIVIAELS